MTVVGKTITQLRKAIRMVDQVKVSQHDMSSAKVLLGGPGIVVLAPSMQVLHLNHQAQILITGLMPSTPEVQQPNNRTGILPPALINLAGVILSALRSRHERNEKGQIEIRHSFNGTGKPVSIRGVGVLNGEGVAQARIVLLLTGTGATHSENEQSLGSIA
jgi:hypothetical protein